MTGASGSNPAVSEFAGLSALVTGGSSGIGLATARLLSERGAQVACVDLAFSNLPEPLVPVVCDVTDDAAVRAAVEYVASTFGGLDVVVNNAGIGAQGGVEHAADEQWREVFEVNVLGVARTSRAALPMLRRSEHAAIVNTCSVAAEVGLPDRAVYSASKGAVLALTRAMAADHVADGIRVNCVTPGTADTPWVQRLLDAAPDPAVERAALEARQPTGRLVGADQVAHAICHLASPAALASTGTALPVDAGMSGLRLPASGKGRYD
ncbi:NAD(P)-dependent dehydrogenase (short-subunit alcohol dehydrogenase family) [Halopolyspora algeriensis]|uniref:NAD(P)-dependent dehydrogenase (Short-subunit alcohol dehydrogenase family) n=1 Tax=Halopolyspora algeriensis TaxID=1500506 RepID=A0A368VV96_9ACTN|nr:SDR family oxidoreductase [Halopolyspora algeriensis]RCW45815.1 NAD(P)-dependent dehydrogenase (short-subunit alcohol dehydrogenase family) [Halopolyspora algeriensis]TQM54199.1 NAD(P)-dependent dehydrogenase (short-subunit alcohol dehydrogenase family) [Halopolyspora algeriensis]